MGGCGGKTLQVVEPRRARETDVSESDTIQEEEVATVDQPATVVAVNRKLQTRRRPSSGADLLEHFQPEKCVVGIVEEDELNRELMDKWLCQKSYTVNSYATVAEAEADISAGDRLDLVIADRDMLCSNGKHVVDFVLTHPTESVHVLPVVLISADVTKQEMERAIRRGAADFLKKPLSRSLMLVTITSLLSAALEARNAEHLKEEGDDLKQKYMLKKLKREALEEAKQNGRSLLNVATPERTTDCTSSVASHTRKIRKQHILIIDTESRTSKISSWLGIKFMVSVCETGIEAVELAREHHTLCVINAANCRSSLSVRPSSSSNIVKKVVDPASVDLIISDYRAVGKFNTPLLAAIEKTPELAGIPVILMGEDVSTETQNTFIQQGCDTFLEKPLSKDLLLTRVKTLLASISDHQHAETLALRAKRYGDMLNLQAAMVDQETGKLDQSGRLPSFDLIAEPTEHEPAIHLPAPMDTLSEPEKCR